MTMKLGPRDQTMVTQDCTDDTSEKERSVLSAGAAVRGNCSRREVSQIAGGWQSTSVCNFGSGPQTTTATVTGDFQSHVHIEQVSQSARGPSRMVMDMKWLGACPAGRRPGDVVGAGGQVFNMASPPQH